MLKAQLELAVVAQYWQQQGVLPSGTPRRVLLFVQKRHGTLATASAVTTLTTLLLLSLGPEVPLRAACKLCGFLHTTLSKLSRCCSHTP